MSSKRVDGESRIKRLRSLVMFMPPGRDKEDLLYLLKRVDNLRVKTRRLASKLGVQGRRIKNLEVERDRLSGALNLARYFLEKSQDRIKRQDMQIKWLSKLNRKKGNLPVEEEALVKSIENRIRREEEISERENLL